MKGAIKFGRECLGTSLHVHNVRDISQAKLENEINARFRSNEHSDLYLSYNFCVKIILFKLKN